jgi:hypothetical protein
LESQHGKAQILLFYYLEKIDYQNFTFDKKVKTHVSHGKQPNRNNKFDKNADFKLPIGDLYCAGLQSNTIVYEIFNPVYSRIIASQRKFY